MAAIVLLAALGAVVLSFCTLANMRISDNAFRLYCNGAQCFMALAIGFAVAVAVGAQ